MVNKGGRPRALDEAKRREVCALVSAGASTQQAAKYVGCSVATIKRESSRDHDFRERLQRAKAAASLAPLQAMRQAAQTHWRAAAWMLERSEPKQFGKQHPQHLGAKELRALRRDLLDIFNDEIDHPVLRERVAKRVKAAIDYAMRHAWDGRRTGSELRAAMEFFAGRDTEDRLPIDPWGLPGSFSFEPSSMALPATHDGSSSTPQNETIGAIVSKYCTGHEQNDSGFPAPDETPPAQNP